MTVTVRFAPSPTGNIHIGNARTALFNWLFALKNGGHFVQRFDDTDVGRSRQEYADQILYDLHWLGVHPDVTVHQSARFDTYAAAVERLKAAGVLYACYETPEELELRRKILLSRRLPPVYGREALKLSQAEKDAFEADGRKPHWRFLLPNFDSDPFAPKRTEVHWDDLVRGAETVDLASVSDPVLVRGDGSYLYTFTSVVDDIELGITHVIRGDDHVTNTGVQIALFRALGAEPPAFGHHNTLTTSTGEGLSKRSGALSIAGLAESGIEPMAVVSLAVLIGTSENVSAMSSMQELAAHFELAGTSKSAAKFDPAELTVLNRVLIHHMPFDEAKSRLAAIGIAGGSRRSVLARGARQSRHGRRCGALVADRRLRAGSAAGHVGRGPRIRARRLRLPAARTVGPRHLEGLDGRGQGGERPQGQGALPCRCGWRLPDLLRARSLQIYCPCWVGKEHWPDDPDLALACRGDRRRGRLRLRMRLIVSPSEPALAIGNGLGIVGRVWLADRCRRHRRDRCRLLDGLPADDREAVGRLRAAAGLRPGPVAIEVGGRQRRIGLAGAGRDHRSPNPRRPLAGSRAASRRLGRSIRNSSGRGRNRPTRNWATSGNSSRRRCARTWWRTGRPVR